MELSRRTIQRMILRKSGDTTVINQGSEDGGGGSQPSVALGPLLTSLNSEAMPTAEGYLHWTGSAWAFDTPTGGDPVDLTPYALKTWVQDNFAYKNDLVNFITRTEAESEFAPISHTHDNYLPLSAGPNKALTGSLYFSGNSGINWAGGVGMLACTPESGWTGISASQWGVGATSAQGVIRSNANDILHYRNGTNYKIWDAYNFTPSDYLPLTGGTVESLTVTNGLDADSITVGSIVNSDTLAEYLDADAMQTWLQQQGYITQTTADGRYIKGVSVYGSSLTPDANRVVNIPYADINTPGVIQIGTGLVNDNEGHTTVDTTVIASRQWADGRYLPLTGGIVSYVYISNGRVGEAVGGIFNANGVMTLGGESVAVSSDGSFTFNGSQVATQTWAENLYMKKSDKAGLFTQFANYDGAVQITIGGTQKSLTIAYANAAGSANTAVNADKLDNHHADDFALASALGNYLPLTGGTMAGPLNMDSYMLSFGTTAAIYYVGGLAGNILVLNADNVDIMTAGGNFRWNSQKVATQPWVTAQLGSYLPLTGGTVNGNLNVKGTIQAQDSNGNNKVIIYGTTGNIRAEKVYIGGSTSGYEAATHNWVTSQGYQANVIETVKVAGTALTPTNKAVDIPSATSDGSAFGVVAIGTGFVFDEDRLCVDTSTFVTALGVSGDNLTYTKNGSTTNLTVPFATDSKALRNFFDSRPASANIQYGDGKLRHYMATSSMTTGKPHVDAHIIHSAWDNTGGYDAQLAIGNVNSGLFFRTQSQGTWQAWKQVAILDDLSGYATQSWVNGRGFASNQDLYDLGTLVTTGYLPLTAGSSHPLTGSLYVTPGSGIHQTVEIDGSQYKIGLTIGTDNVNRGLYGYMIGGGNDWLLYFDASNTILNYGNVGIGTTSPKYKLDVNGSMKIAGALYGAGGYIDLQYSDEINRYGGNLYLQHRGGGITGTGTGSGNTGNLIMCAYGGNVGIGTTTPSYKLDVNGNTGVTGSLDVSIELSVGDVTNGGVWLSDSALGVWTMSGTSRQETELMSLASGGVTFSGDTIMTRKLAVGTTTFDGSNAKLQVGGNMFATGSIMSKSNAGNVSLGNGNISATNLYISTVVFGNSNNDAAFYVSNGHIWARNSSGTSTMIV